MPPSQSTSPRQAQLPGRLAPVDGFALQRVGPAHDGGYVVATESIGPTEWLLSLGLADDWRFERDFQRLTGADVTAVDATTGPTMWVQTGAVKALLTASGRRFRAPLSEYYNNESGYLRYRMFFGHESREHLRDWVGDGGDGTVSIAELLERRPGAATFLKMDIEGSEWRTLGDIVSHQDRFTGMVIEFHDVDLRLERLEAFVADLNDFAIVCTTANNAGRVTADGIPTVVELSFARREHRAAGTNPTSSTDGTAATASGAPALTAPNVPYSPPITLAFEA